MEKKIYLDREFVQNRLDELKMDYNEFGLRMGCSYSHARKLALGEQVVVKYRLPMIARVLECEESEIIKKDKPKQVEEPEQVTVEKVEDRVPVMSPIINVPTPIVNVPEPVVNVNLDELTAQIKDITKGMGNMLNFTNQTLAAIVDSLNRIYKEINAIKEGRN